jgi:hypothetical protein
MQIDTTSGNKVVYSEAQIRAKRKYYEKNKTKIIAASSAYNKANPKNNSTSAKKWRDQNPEKRMHLVAKRRAKLKNLEFNIDVADIIIPSVCPILGIPLLRGLGKIDRGSPSLDRIDIKKGYIKGNVQVISAKANMMKNDASFEELKLFAKWVNKCVL